MANNQKLPPTQQAALTRLQAEQRVSWCSTTSIEARAFNALVQKGFATKSDSVYYLVERNPGATLDPSPALKPTAADLERLRHMLGAKRDTPKARWGYRNYFDAGADAVPSMERLVAAGLATKGHPFNKLTSFYYATEAGCRAVGLTTAQIKKAFEP